MSSAEIVGYEGRARLGAEATSGREVSVRIHDVEDPHWMAVILAGADRVSAVGEVPVTLLDDGLYEGWRGTAIVSKRANGPMRLMGHEPFEPPVGA